MTFQDTSMLCDQAFSAAALQGSFPFGRRHTITRVKHIIRGVLTAKGDLPSNLAATFKF